MIEINYNEMWIRTLFASYIISGVGMYSGLNKEIKPLIDTHT